MQAFALLALLAASANANVLKARASCNADLCARSVTGTANPTPNVSSRRADCSSFFVTTIIPPTTTPTTTLSQTTVFTSTTTVTSGVTTSTTTVLYMPEVGPSKREVEVEKRQATTSTTVTATAVPAYASPCSGAVRYSSACSCANVGRQTVVMASPVAPTVTSYSTTITTVSTSTSVVPTVTATHTACTPDNNFDYVYDETEGGGAQLSSYQDTTAQGDRYKCCSSCYVASAPANCAGTVFDGGSGNCYVFTTSGGYDMTEQCPGGRGNVQDKPGDRVQLAQCGTTRPLGSPPPNRG